MMIRQRRAFSALRLWVRCLRRARPLSLPAQAGEGSSPSPDDKVQADLALQRGACRVERDRPGLVADDAVRGDAAPALEGLHSGFGLRPEIAIDALRGDVP